VLLIALLLTSSRGGLLGLVAVLAVLVLTPSARPQMGKSYNHIVLSLLGPLVASGLVWPNLPAKIRARLSNVTELRIDYNM
jgi:hypothetical protein